MHEILMKKEKKGTFRLLVSTTENNLMWILIKLCIKQI